jgi:glycosyltransferase involved in cell wall biosynthesis
MSLDVTVVIPVKNEAVNLPHCLDCVRKFPHVLVVDSGSTDATCELATAAGAEVLRFDWNGRFPKKRNWVLRNHDFQTEWVLFLDADEFVNEAFVSEVERTLAATDCVGFWLNYERWFLGRPLKHGDEFLKLALFRVGAGEYERIEESRWSGLDMEIHEHPVLKGPTGEIAAPIEHNEYRGLAHYIAKHNEYSSWEAARYVQLIAAGVGVQSDSEGCGDCPQSPEWDRLTPRQQKKYRHLAKWWAAPVYFLRGYFLKKGFLDGAVGFHFAWMKAVYFYQIRLKIRELSEKD